MKTLAALALIVAALPVHAEVREWRFAATFNDRPIGEHVFRLEGSGSNLALTSSARFNVRLLGVTVLRYDHRAAERWQGGCLAALDATTQRNSQTRRVEARREAAGLAVTDMDGKTETHPGCVMSFAYWNPAILRQSRLLNAETGEYHSVRIRALGSETIESRGREISAQRHRIEADKLRIDVWYDEAGQWVALESPVTGGTLRYTLAP